VSGERARSRRYVKESRKRQGMGAPWGLIALFGVVMLTFLVGVYKGWW